MLGLSRLAYSLATNRQIPSAVGRLHPTRGTPYVVIVASPRVLASALVIPADLDFLVGIYAFGALLAFTIAHLSVIVLRYREPDRDRPYRMPLSVPVRGGPLPLPAVLGGAAVGAPAGSACSSCTTARAASASPGWSAGIALYVVYRTTEGKPLLKRVTIPETALRARAGRGRVRLDPRADLRARRSTTTSCRPPAASPARRATDEGEGGAMIEALWVFEVPMSLPIDARAARARSSSAARQALRARQGGRGGVRGRRGRRPRRCARAAPAQAIVEEARRRGVEAIVLAAEEPSRIRGGALLGGRGGPLDNFVGEVTKYVVEQGALPRDPHRAARRAARGRPPTATVPPPRRRSERRSPEARPPSPSR